MINEPLQEKALGSYLSFACSELLGATVEFMPLKQIQRRYGVHNIPKALVGPLG